MSIAGNIKTFPLTDLLQWFSISRKSGVLSITFGDIDVAMFIRKGILLSAVTNEASRRIGQYLLSRGYIDENCLKLALNLQEKGAGELRLGEILCQNGTISRELLKKALHERTEEIVYDLFLIPDGNFHFDAATDFPNDIVELNINLDFLVLEGIRRKDEWERIHSVLPSDSVRVVKRSDHKGVVESVSDLARFLLTQIGEEKTVGELVMKTRRSPFDVYSALYCLLEEECLEITAVQEEPSTKSGSVQSVRVLEEEIRRLLGGRDFNRARQRLRDLRGHILDSDWLEKMEAWVLHEERAFLVNRFPHQAVPIVVKDINKIRRDEFGPREGFLLSRLGEGLDVKTLTQVMPLAELHILRILQTFEKKGIICIKSGTRASS